MEGGRSVVDDGGAALRGGGGLVSECDGRHGRGNEMNIGECPYDDCDDVQAREIPDAPLPAFSKEECPGCGREIWMKYSRIDPEAFTPEQFAADWVVDHETKVIKPRDRK
jgi:hypothetical protein